MVYTFEQIHAVDPNNPAVVASNGSVTIFAPGDLTMTPVQIFTPDGLPLQNPIIVNSQGYGPAFIHQTLDRVAWSGGGFSGYFTAYEGLKDAAVAAQSAAELAASSSEVSSKAAVDALALVAAPSSSIVTQVLADPTSQARTILNGAYALKGEGGGGGTSSIVEDSANPGLFFVVEGGQIVKHPSLTGFYTIGAV